MREPMRDYGRLEHIAEQLQNIKEFTEGKSIANLMDNKILQYAVVKCV